MGCTYYGVPYRTVLYSKKIFTVNEIYMAILNICMALFHMFGANHIIYIHSFNYKYIYSIQQIFIPFSFRYI